MKDHERAYPCRCTACGHAEITAVGDCPRCNKKGAMKLKYSAPGQCPKCGRQLYFQPQTGIVPPNWGRHNCSYHDWDMKGFIAPNFDLLPQSERPR